MKKELPFVRHPNEAYTKANQKKDFDNQAGYRWTKANSSNVKDILTGEVLDKNIVRLPHSFKAGDAVVFKRSGREGVVDKIFVRHLCGVFRIRVKSIKPNRTETVPYNWLNLK